MAKVKIEQLAKIQTLLKNRHPDSECPAVELQFEPGAKIIIPENDDSGLQLRLYAVDVDKTESWQDKVQRAGVRSVDSWTTPDKFPMDCTCFRSEIAMVVTPYGKLAAWQEQNLRIGCGLEYARLEVLLALVEQYREVAEYLPLVAQGTRYCTTGGVHGPIPFYPAIAADWELTHSRSEKMRMGYTRVFVL